MSQRHGSIACLTVDLDWAPDFMLDDLCELLAAAGLPLTFFCTHHSPAVERLLALPGCESALHPNFLGGRTEGEVLGELRGLFPLARGVRSHALYHSSRLLPLYHQAGLEYSSHDLLFLEPDLRPSYDWSGLTRLPIFWEDDVHCIYFGPSFRLADLGLERPGLKVLSVHPVHVYLNSRDMVAYQGCKEAVRDPARAMAHRCAGHGVRTLFLEILRALQQEELRTLGQVVSEFRATHGYRGRFPEYLAGLRAPSGPEPSP